MARNVAKKGKEQPATGMRRFLRTLGPGLITGAADDDPSGIGTHSQIGAQFGYGLSWTFVLSFPLMVAIQQVAAEIGRVTGAGIARNLRLHYPRPVLWAMVLLLLVANVSFAEAYFPGVTAGTWQCKWARCLRCVPPDNHRMHLARVALGFGPR